MNMATGTYHCPNCGAGLKYQPDLQKVTCDFCRSSFLPAEIEAFENKKQTKKAADQADVEHLVAYHCDNCGAEVVTDDTTAATFCYYCHNPVLITERLSGVFRPQKVIPFTIDKDSAIKRFQEYANKWKFIPRDFTGASQLEKMTGLYLPHWMVDYEADIDYSGKATQIRRWTTGQTEYTEHKEFNVNRQGTIAVNHLHEVAIRKIDKGLIDSITPYDETKAVDFSSAYLAGFFAEKYDIEQSEVEEPVAERARQYVRTLVQDTIGAYHEIQLERSSIDFHSVDWTYALLPAWVLTYQYRGQTYLYAVNGQTGKVFGSLPVNNRKLGLTSGIIAAVLLAAAVLGGLFLW